MNQDKRRRFDSYPGSITAGQALLTLAERPRQDADCARRFALCVAVEAPLPEPEGDRELVWREGYGWVDRPVEVPEQAEPREVAAA